MIFGTDFPRQCQRCGVPTTVLKMSFFNTEMCCSKCISIESDHPAIHQAKAAEREAIRSGDMNFPGVGLPEGYAEWAADRGSKPPNPAEE